MSIKLFTAIIEMIMIWCVVLLMSCTAGLRLSPNDYMDTYTTTETAVYHMAEDRFKPGNVLLSDGGSLKSTDGTTTSVIVGSVRQSGYTEGVGDQARFIAITSFIQLTNTNVLAVDYSNHCFRTVDRLTNSTATYIGTCEVFGYRDGTDALFYYPTAIIEDLKNPGHYFITEFSGKALSYLSVSGGEKNVTSLYRGALRYTYMAQKKSTGDVYITYYNGVTAYDYLSETMSNLAGFTSAGFVDGDFSLINFFYPRGIVFLSDDRILIADYSNNRLRLLDLTTNTSTSICSGTLGHEDGNLTFCQLFYPLSLLIIHETLYVGNFQIIRKIHGTTASTPTTGPLNGITETTHTVHQTSVVLDETTTSRSTTEEILTTYDDKSTKETILTTITEQPTETTETTQRLKRTSTSLEATTTHKPTTEELSTIYGTLLTMTERQTETTETTNMLRRTSTHSDEATTNRPTTRDFSTLYGTQSTKETILTTITEQPTETTETTQRLKRTSTSLEATTTHKPTTEELSTIYGTLLTMTERQTETTETTNMLRRTSTHSDEATTNRPTTRDFSTLYGTQSTKDARTTGKTTEPPILSNNSIIEISAPVAGTIILLALFILVAYIVRLRSQPNSATQSADNSNIRMGTISGTAGENQNMASHEDNPTYTSLDQNTTDDHVYSTTNPGADNTQPIKSEKHISTGNQNPSEGSYLYPRTDLADSQIYSEPNY